MIQIVLVAFIIGFSSPAYAYIDPGTGSMIVQIIIGAVVAGLVVIKSYWHRIKTFLSGGKTDTPKDTD